MLAPTLCASYRFVALPPGELSPAPLVLPVGLVAVLLVVLLRLSALALHGHRELTAVEGEAASRREQGEVRTRAVRGGVLARDILPRQSPAGCRYTLVGVRRAGCRVPLAIWRVQT